MFAPDPPAAVQPSNSASSSLIEIVGVRSDQAQKIDRRTFRVKDNPNSAQADTIRLLRGLPAVTITPDDQIRLLGSGNVTILVDERLIRGDVTQYLRTLHGSDIERIEIITNPSAQYSPQGTGGIINIVLRRKRREGLSGSVSGEALSTGRTQDGATVTYKTGKWTGEFQAQAGGGEASRLSYHKLRTIEAPLGGVQTVNTEDGHQSSKDLWGFGRAKLTYAWSDRTDLSVEGFAGEYHSSEHRRIEFVGLTPDFNSFSERDRSSSTASFHGVQVFFDHKGSKEGETLKASAGLFALPRETWRNRIETDSGPLSIENRNPWRSANAQIDWQHPIGKREILSLGGTWTHENTRRRYVFDNVAGNEGLGPDFSGQFDTRIDTAAAYITFQQQLGSWTIMPGGRMELYSRTISSPGLPDASVKRAQAYPSFHLDHPLSKALDLTVSYSRRIDRPSGDQLRPYAMVTGIQSISLGNPALRDQTTDAYEINLHYHRKHIDAGLIVYDRETSGVWSTGYSVNADGINVVRPVNAGHKTDRGAEIDFNTPILTRVKLSTSINLFDSRVPFDPLLGQSSFASFRSTGNATLEWDGADRGKRPGDIAQLQLTYESARRDYQIRYDARASINLSYTHSFTPTLSLTASADGIGARHFRHVLTAPTVQEDFDRRETLPFFRLKLSKTFGGGKPTSSAPAMPLPQPR